MARGDWQPYDPSRPPEGVVDIWVEQPGREPWPQTFCQLSDGRWVDGRGQWAFVPEGAVVTHWRRYVGPNGVDRSSLLCTWADQRKREMQQREDLVISWLAASGGNVSAAAKGLGIDRTQLHRFIRERKLRKPKKLAYAGAGA